jgi:anti-sigma B factor antagonist
MAQDTGELTVDVRHLGTTVEMNLSGELDIATAPTVRHHVARVLQERPEIAVVNLRQVTFIDSSGLHTLLASRKHAVAMGSSLVVIRPAGPADRAFTLSGLDTIFPTIAGADASTSRTPDQTRGAVLTPAHVGSRDGGAEL